MTIHRRGYQSRARIFPLKLTEPSMVSRASELLALLVLLTACPAIAHDSYYTALPPAPQVFACDGGVSNSFDITGDVINPQSINLQSLQALTPSTTVWDYFVAGSSTSQGEFSGILCTTAMQ
jgi:hypothetical protein